MSTHDLNRTFPPADLNITIPPQDFNYNPPPKTIKLSASAHALPQTQTFPQTQPLTGSWRTFAPLTPGLAPSPMTMDMQIEKSPLLKSPVSRPKPAASVFVQVLLMASVILLGCASIISRQICAKSLKRFSYMLSLTTAVAYTFVYFGILFVLIKTRRVSYSQFEWAWSSAKASFVSSSKLAPWIKFFLLAALGDALGDTFGYICTPYVAGPIHSLLSQFTVMFTVPLSFFVLGSRYSFYQFLGLVGVEVAVVIGVIPSLGGKAENSTNAGFAALLGGSCFFNALAFVMKELSFFTYMTELYHTTRRSFKGFQEERESGLSIFIVNSHTSLFQLPFTLLLVPLAQATGQAPGENIFKYLKEGFGCLSGDTTESSTCSYSGRWTLLYIFCNISWNLVILLNVKINGSVATFVALKAMFPICIVLFAYVHWPMLGTTHVHTVTWLVLAIIIPFAGFYTWASVQQQALGDKAICCGCPPCCKEEEAGAMELNELSTPASASLASQRALGSFGALGSAGTFGSLGTSFSPSILSDQREIEEPSETSEPSEHTSFWPCGLISEETEEEEE